MKLKPHSLFVDTFIIGLIGAFSAQIFIFLLHFFQHISNMLIHNTFLTNICDKYGLPHGVILVFVITTGGLISGLLVYLFAPEAEGHGTDTVVRAFHRTGGYLRPVVVPIKILASAITIGTGGSAGKEGPTALFSAGIGSIYSDWRNVSWKKRQIFVLIGMASGLSAVFKAPLGTSFFAVEVLYMSTEIESRELIYVLFGPLVAYVMSCYIFGWEDIFTFPQNLFLDSYKDYILVALLGIISGFVSVFLPNFFYTTRDFFRKLSVNPIFKPAIGAFIVGIIGVYFPQVLGGGYEPIQQAINGEFIAKMALFLLVAKILAFTFTVASGGSGGVFAPTLFIGAMVGVIFASLLHIEVTPYVLIAMAAVFGAAARTPLAAIIMVLEMSGGYNLLPVTLLGVLSAFVTHNFLSKKLNVKYVSLYEAQLINSSYSIINQIERLKDILICNSQIFGFDIQKIRNENLITLLENGNPIEVGENKYVYFGSFKRRAKLQLKEGVKHYKGAYVLYIFRNGNWYNPNEINMLIPNDQVLLYGSKNDIMKIRHDFKPVSNIFSKLKMQEEKIEKVD